MKQLPRKCKPILIRQWQLKAYKARHQRLEGITYRLNRTEQVLVTRACGQENILPAHYGAVLTAAHIQQGVGNPSNYVKGISLLSLKEVWMPTTPPRRLAYARGTSGLTAWSIPAGCWATLKVCLSVESM